MDGNGLYNIQAGNVARERYLNSRIGVGLPLVQAVVTGVLVGLTAGTLASLAELTRPFVIGVVIGAGASTLAWLASWRNWLTTMQAIERRTGAGIYSSTTTKVERVRFEIKQENGRNMQFIDLPADIHQLTTLADGLLSGATFNESTWTGKDAPFSLGEFRKLRTELLKRQLLEWVNPKSRSQGLRLTRTGLAAFRYIAELPSPTPQAESDLIEWG